MQPYYSPPTNTRISTEGQAAARGSVKALTTHVLGLRKPRRLSPHSWGAVSNKSMGRKDSRHQETNSTNQNCWRKHQLVDPPWRARCNYLSIPRIFQVSINAATSINTTKCMDPHTQQSRFLESSYRHTQTRAMWRTYRMFCSWQAQD